MVDKTSQENTTYRIHRVMAEAWAHTALHDTLQVVAEGVTEVAGFGVAAISVLHDSGETETVAVAGNDEAREALLGTFVPVASIMSELAVAEHWGRLRFIPHERIGDVVSTGWIPDLTPIDASDAWHPLDMLVAPLEDDDGVLRGFLSVDLPDDGLRPGIERRARLEMYADQASRAILRAIERERLGEQVRLAEATRKIVRGASAQFSLERIIEDCQRAIVEGFRIQGLWVHTFDGDDVEGHGRGFVYSSDGRDVQLPEEMIALAIPAARLCWEEQRVGLISRRRSATGIATPEESEQILGFLASLDITSIMFVPLGAGPECLGNLVLTRDENDPEWTDAEATAALDIGHDLGRAILNARMFETERHLVDELQALDRYKTQLISTVSHELKNPLTTIGGHLELLRDEDLDPDTRLSLSAIARSSERLNRLVEDLLLLSKVGDPSNPLIPAPVDLDVIVADVVDAFATQAAAGDVRLTFYRPIHPVVANGEFAELESLFTNLVSNALRYTPAGGSVTLSLSVDGPDVLLTCADDGIGISATDQARLFNEFFRSTNPRALALPGTGLGLAISQRIVARHNGRIDVRSTLGDGSTFTVRLPAHR